MSKNDQVQELLSQAIALLDEPKGRYGEKSAKVSVLDIIPDGVKLYASKARPIGNQTEGSWYWYLVMPRGWNPPEPNEGDKRWMRNETDGTYWDHGTAAAWKTDEPNTKTAAIAKGTIRLMEVLA